MGYKIAVVEDDPSLRSMYRSKLERSGFSVATASDGEEGLGVCQSFAPHLILLDLKLPKLDGTAMLTKLRATDWGSDIRVIILTNLGKHEAPQALRFLRVDRYVVKAHSTPLQVLDMVREVLGIKA